MMRASVVWTLLLSTFLVPACSGTETDNPVVNNGGDYDSPEQFGPSPAVPPGCVPLPEDALEPPQGLPRALALALPDQRALLLRGDYRGLELWDSSDPANLKRENQDVVRGEIHQLLRSSSGQVWVAATEPPLLSQASLPAASELDAELHLVQLDVSDPRAPVRAAETSLDGDFWQVRERAGDLWVLTGRRVPEQRGCDAVQNLCGFRSYEALELHGFHPDGSALEPIASAELPLGQRVWWGTDGVATVTVDGSLHILMWDGSGQLRAPIQLPAPGAEPWNGPLEIVGSELRFVGSANGHATLYRFDLDSGATQPSSTFDLGAHTAPPSAFSLLSASKLWLNFSGEPAELWDIGGPTPLRSTLPGSFSRLLPLPDAVLDGQPGVALALGWVTPEQTTQYQLLGLDDSGVRVVSSLSEPALGSSSGIPAPANLHGSGTAPSWEIVERGAGLPLGIDPSAPPDYLLSPYVQALVGVPASDGATLAEAALLAPALAGTAVQPNPRLEIRAAAGTTSFELSPGSGSLLALPNGVLVLALDDAQSCPQSGRDCRGYAPGVTLFDAASTPPRQVATLPMPELPIGVPWDPSRMSLDWNSYDPLTQAERSAQPFGPDQLVFVADVELSCDAEADCAALGIRAVPIAQAGVAIATPAPCPSPEIAPDCVDQPYTPPTVYGESHRQYVYALQIAGDGAPGWQALGVSTLESVSGNPQQSSRFAAPVALGSTLAVTRLERFRSGQLLPAGQNRFMLDRFALSAAGEPEQLAPVNVPGYPLARLGADERAEYWVSAEPLPGETGRARLHRLRISAAGAESEQTLELEGAFGGLWPIQIGESWFGLTLSNPENGCGVTRLGAVALGSSSPSSVALQRSSVLDLPSDDWQLLALDGPRAALRRGSTYVLVELQASGTLQVSSLQSSATYVDQAQLLGSTLRGASSYGELRLNF